MSTIKSGIPESRMAEYVSAIHRGVIVGANSLVVFDGICEVLKSLSSENDLGVITANASEATDRFLIHHGIRDYFSFIVGCETIGSKSEKITDIIDRNGYPVSDVYFVGDAGTDIQQGKLSGVNTIAVTWGFQGRSRLEKEKPDFIVDNMKDLSHILME